MAHETDLMTWLVADGKTAFYLDGVLYRMLSLDKDDALKAGVRGRANFAGYQVHHDRVGAELTLWRWGQPPELVQLDERVTVEGDVAVRESWVERRPNKLARVRGELRTFGLSHLDVYQRARRRMAVVDYLIIEDNVGIRRADGSWKVEPSVKRVPDALGEGRDAVVFEPINDLSEAKFRSFIVPADSEDFVIVGPNIAFTTRERAEAGESFL